MKFIKKYYKKETVVVIHSNKLEKKVKNVDYIKYKNIGKFNFDLYSMIICVDFTHKRYKLVENIIFDKKFIVFRV